MQSASTKQYYNVGTGTKTSIAALLNQQGDMHSKKITARFEPRKHIFVRNRVGSTKKAGGEINVNAEIGLGVGLREFIQCRSNQKLGVGS